MGNCAHNNLICSFQHNNLPTFEQRLWDRIWVLSTWFMMIFVALGRTFCIFFKYTMTFISNSVRCGCLRQDQCNIACLRSCSKQKCTGNWPLPPCKLQGDNELRLVISACFLKLCSKKLYDMPHIGCVIHALQIVRNLSHPYTRLRLHYKKII